jgi:hypothetical protein
MKSLLYPRRQKSARPTEQYGYDVDKERMFILRFVTKTRIEYLQTLLAHITDKQKQSEALQLLESLSRDIDENYAEIERPLRLYEK